MESRNYSLLACFFCHAGPQQIINKLGAPCLRTTPDRNLFTRRELLKRTAIGNRGDTRCADDHRGRLSK